MTVYYWLFNFLHFRVIQCQAVYLFIFENSFQLLLSPFYNLDEPFLEFKKQCCHAVFCFPSHCCFHCLFSHSQTVFQLIPIIPGREFRGVARPTSHSKPNTELGPTGSQVELLLLDVCVHAPQPGSKSILFTLRKTEAKTASA